MGKFFSCRGGTFHAEIWRICPPVIPTQTQTVDPLDTFVVRPHDLDTVPTFLRHTNSVPEFQSLPFTCEVEKEALAFLGLLIKGIDNKFKTSVFRKPVNSGLFLRNNSCHHPAQKSSAISSLTHRSHQVCSSKKLLYEELDFIRSQFLANGFSNYDIVTATWMVPPEHQKPDPSDLDQSHCPRVP